MTDYHSEPNRIHIWTNGHPKSGNTWLGNLLCDALSSPLQNDPGATVAWFGPYRDGNYVIRKRHVPGTDEWTEGERFVYIQRDPRDVVISTTFYRGLQPKDCSHIMATVKQMVTRHVMWKVSQSEVYEALKGEPGLYENWVKPWVTEPYKAMVNTRYEWLHEHGAKELQRIIKGLTGHTLDDDWLERVFRRQMFDKVQAKDAHFYRKGIVGDYKNYFKKQHGRLMQEGLGDFMLSQGYIVDSSWVDELPDCDCEGCND